jgi:hypothetical protein
MGQSLKDEHRTSNIERRTRVKGLGAKAPQLNSPSEFNGVNREGRLGDSLSDSVVRLESPYDNARLNLIALPTSSRLALLSRPRRFSNLSFEMVSIWLVFMIEG